MTIIIVLILLAVIICTMAYFAGNSLMKTSQKISDELHELNELKIKVVNATDYEIVRQLIIELDELNRKYKYDLIGSNSILFVYIKGILEGKIELLDKNNE